MTEYKIQFLPGVEERLDELPEEMKAKVYATLFAIANDPTGLGQPLTREEYDALEETERPTEWTEGMRWIGAAILESPNPTNPPKPT